LSRYGVGDDHARVADVQRASQERPDAGGDGQVHHRAAGMDKRPVGLRRQVIRRADDITSIVEVVRLALGEPGQDAQFGPAAALGVHRGLEAAAPAAGLDDDPRDDAIAVDVVAACKGELAGGGNVDGGLAVVEEPVVGPPQGRVGVPHRVAQVVHAQRLAVAQVRRVVQDAQIGHDAVEVDERVRRAAAAAGVPNDVPAVADAVGRGVDPAGERS
jgi:hypothetical protein